MRKKPAMKLQENTIAERLLRLRVMAGLTQEELCERINYTSNYYGQAERGAIPLSRKLADALRTFYNTSYDYLYYGVRSDRVGEESSYTCRNMMYSLLDGCTEDECETLYQISKVVVRNFRDHKEREMAARLEQGMETSVADDI